MLRRPLSSCGTAPSLRCNSYNMQSLWEGVGCAPGKVVCLPKNSRKSVACEGGQHLFLLVPLYHLPQQHAVNEVSGQASRTYVRTCRSIVPENHTAVCVSSH